MERQPTVNRLTIHFAYSVKDTLERTFWENLVLCDGQGVSQQRGPSTYWPPVFCRLCAAFCKVGWSLDFVLSKTNEESLPLAAFPPPAHCCLKSFGRSERQEELWCQPLPLPSYSWGVRVRHPQNNIPMLLTLTLHVLLNENLTRFWIHKKTLPDPDPLSLYLRPWVS